MSELYLIAYAVFCFLMVAGMIFKGLFFAAAIVFIWWMVSNYVAIMLLKRKD